MAYLLLTIHNSLLTIHNSLLTIHYSQFTTHHSQLTIHNSQLTIHNSLFINHKLSATAVKPSCVLYHLGAKFSKIWLATYCGLKTSTVVLAAKPAGLENMVSSRKANCYSFVDSLFSLEASGAGVETSAPSFNASTNLGKAKAFGLYTKWYNLEASFHIFDPTASFGRYIAHGA